MQSKKTKEVTVGKIGIGGNNPVRVQSMTTTNIEKMNQTLEQILQLKEAGCELVRVAVPSLKYVPYYQQLKKEIKDYPLIADVHFDYKTALKLIDIGADKVRINPGNIVIQSLGGEKKVKEIVVSARQNQVPLRIGVNSGSLEKELLEKYGWPKPPALVESALKWVSFCENLNFEQIVVSLKSSSVTDCISAYTLFSKKSSYPLHIGITEAGPSPKGMIKSAVGLGILLHQGIGDTIRVSLTDHPVKEVETAWEILKSLSIRNYGSDIVACPTCGRCKVDMIPLTNYVEKKFSNLKKPLTIAIMGCEVNGPGEAKRADIGIAFGKGVGLLFKKGKIIKKVKEENALKALEEEINLMGGDGNSEG